MGTIQDRINVVLTNNIQEPDIKPSEGQSILQQTMLAMVSILGSFERGACAASGSAIFEDKAEWTRRRLREDWRMGGSGPGACVFFWILYFCSFFYQTQNCVEKEPYVKLSYGGPVWQESAFVPSFISFFCPLVLLWFCVCLLFLCSVSDQRQSSVEQAPLIRLKPSMKDERRVRAGRCIWWHAPCLSLFNRGHGFNSASQQEAATLGIEVVCTALEVAARRM